VLRSMKETGEMALFLLVRRAGRLTADQSKPAVLLGFWAVRCASCVPAFESNPPKMPLGPAI
jgi:hypothetical protein